MSAPVYEDIVDNGDKYYKMIFYFDYTLPEDCTLVDIGTIKVKDIDLSSQGITLNTENVSQYSVLSKLGVDGQFYYSKANYYGIGHTVAGYMIYEKNGIRYTVYSNALYGTKKISQAKEECNMREKYETPEMEVIEFEIEDVITTSSNIGGGDEGLCG